jgi:hypothetical protein
MTVCVAALAANSGAVVCVADKAVTYGHHIQWESDTSKIVAINPSKSALVMFSGGNEGTSKMLSRLIVRAEEIGSDAEATLKICEDEYKAELEEQIDSRFFRPHGFKRTEYIAATSGPSINEHVRDIADDIRDFDMDCDLIVCGFDSSAHAFILNVRHPGVGQDLTSTGFHAIGSGWDKAIARMLWSQHKRVHPIERVLYDAFDAKANAELAFGVGYAWDARIVIPNKEPVTVSSKIRDLTERLWDECVRSPFEPWNPDDYAKPPPRTWKSQLRKYSASILGREYEEPEEE